MKLFSILRLAKAKTDRQMYMYVSTRVEIPTNGPLIILNKDTEKYIFLRTCSCFFIQMISVEIIKGLLKLLCSDHLLPNFCRSQLHYSISLNVVGH